MHDWSKHAITYDLGQHTKRITADTLSPLRAIRLKCIDCSGGSVVEVTKCVIPDCPLWPFRAGKNPMRKPKVLSEEQRARLAAQLARGRQASIESLPVPLHTQQGETAQDSKPDQSIDQGALTRF
ncbi:MAG: hypothetical protein NTY19_04825 [Planctomycetota bacterium]|nr:hypothetical protein [Planctomycetota bacterium]